MHHEDDFYEFAPDFRATVVDGEVTLARWRAGLLGQGVLGDVVAARARDGISVADLSIMPTSDGSDVSVSFLAVADETAARQALTTWAGCAGHRRVWFQDEVVDARPPLALGAAVVRCPTCESRWLEEDSRFWALVLRRGTFPTSCPVCGGMLPQWRVLATSPTSTVDTEEAT